MTRTSVADGSAASTREALLGAALAELAACGHAGISLRAVARRAGVSHAAPKHHFTDRSGLLTAVATRGFLELASALDRVTESDPQLRLAALGRTYIDYGLASPALFDLMFRPVELDPADHALQQARAAALAALTSTVGDAPAPRNSRHATSTLMAWALVHGLVVLTRDGALQAPSDPDAPTGPELAHLVADEFTRLLTGAATTGRR